VRRPRHDGGSFTGCRHPISKAQSGIFASGNQENLPMPAVELFHLEPQKLKTTTHQLVTVANTRRI
jgi:hypothetical protein